MMTPRKSSNFKLYDRPKGKANKTAKKSQCNKSVAGMIDPNAEYVVNIKAAQNGLCFGETRQLPVAKTDKDVEMMWAYKRLRGESQ